MLLFTQARFKMIKQELIFIFNEIKRNRKKFGTKILRKANGTINIWYYKNKQNFNYLSKNEGALNKPIDTLFDPKMPTFFAHHDFLVRFCLSSNFKFIVIFLKYKLFYMKKVLKCIKFP